MHLLTTRRQPLLENGDQPREDESHMLQCTVQRSHQRTHSSRAWAVYTGRRVDNLGAHWSLPCTSIGISWKNMYSCMVSSQTRMTKSRHYLHTTLVHLTFFKLSQTASNSFCQFPPLPPWSNILVMLIPRGIQYWEEQVWAMKASHEIGVAHLIAKSTTNSRSDLYPSMIRLLLSAIRLSDPQKMSKIWPQRRRCGVRWERWIHGLTRSGGVEGYARSTR